MVSFFEKLKKGMGIENIEEPEPQEEISKKEAVQQKLKDKTTKSPSKKKALKKIKIESETIEPEAKEVKEELKKPEMPKPEIKKEAPAKNNNRSFSLQNLAPEEEGQLAVDVYQTDTELVIQSTIAGVKPEDLDISIEADTVLIRGNRIQCVEPGDKNYFYQECYWGPFSRQIIIAEETDPSRAEATIKEGVLTIKIPRIERNKKRKITVKG